MNLSRFEGQSDNYSMTGISEEGLGNIPKSSARREVPDSPGEIGKRDVGFHGGQRLNPSDNSTQSVNNLIPRVTCDLSTVRATVLPHEDGSSPQHLRPQQQHPRRSQPPEGTEDNNSTAVTCHNIAQDSMDDLSYPQNHSNPGIPKRQTSKTCTENGNYSQERSDENDASSRIDYLLAHLRDQVVSDHDSLFFPPASAVEGIKSVPSVCVSVSQRAHG